MNSPPYNMVFDWSTQQCAWIFKSWNSSSTSGFLIGCLLTFITCFLSAGFGIIKQKILIKNSSKMNQTIMFFLGYLLKMIIMLLMMSMNVWINLLIVIGTALGYVVFQNIKRNKNLSKKL